ncbi:hypothetical protein C8A00DRAFT_35127 [Chaetomidium leptoderma]|uniref:Uncharacterized protein n=1 Tax=Chaetomidium leptoderma TaxID=669021 RepID=A0AAN6VJX8_9PEZI|nr:hypothetical protein C8A00DRAFT_35127 [Chaetomidium leptoderma]
MDMDALDTLDVDRPLLLPLFAIPPHLPAEHVRHKVEELKAMLGPVLDEKRAHGRAVSYSTERQTLHVLSQCSAVLGPGRDHNTDTNRLVINVVRDLVEHIRMGEEYAPAVACLQDLWKECFLEQYSHYAASFKKETKMDLVNVADTAYISLSPLGSPTIVYAPPLLHPLPPVPRGMDPEVWVLFLSCRWLDIYKRMCAEYAAEATVADNPDLPASAQTQPHLLNLLRRLATLTNTQLPRIVMAITTYAHYTSPMVPSLPTLGVWGNHEEFKIRLELEWQGLDQTPLEDRAIKRIKKLISDMASEYLEVLPFDHARGLFAK